MRITSTATQPPLTLVLAVAVISAAVLGFEVALTRVFSVLLRYHFGFLVISIALCGLGIGGYAAHWLRQRKALSLPLLALLFAISIDVALALMLRVIFAYFPEAFWVTALVLLVPFSIAGAFLAEAFARYSQWAGRLYAWDLAGAALAAVGVVGLLQVFGGIDACLCSAVLAAVAAVLLVDQHASATLRSIVVGICACLALVFIGNGIIRFGREAGQGGAKMLDIPAIPPRVDANNQSLADKNVTQPLFTELGTPGHTSRIVSTDWNAFARTDVVADTVDPETLLIYTNGNVPTNMMRWNGDLSIINRIAASFPLSDWAFAIAPLGKKGNKGSMQRRGRVLSIGPGGGLDALLSLYHGASQFDGAELNPSIVGIMRDYRKFNGGIYERPDVHVVTREGRAFVREAVAQGQRYSMIFSALTKTATAGQGMALLESFIHTEDAFSDYQKALDTNGQLTLVVDNPALLARFFTTAVSLLKAQGMSETTACQHIILMHDPRPYGPYQFALVLQKSVLSRAQTFDIFDRATERQLIPIWIPYQASRPEFGPYPDIASGRINLDQFIQWFGQLGQPLDITPCPDDRPFVLDLSPTLLPIFKQLTALVLLLSLALAGLGAFDVARRQPSLSNTSTASHDTLDEEVGSEVVNASGGTTVTPAWGLTDVLYVFYFLCLGLGFMLVEIPLSQKLILPLGYPTLALTVILFSVLLGGGLGSWFSQNVADERLSRWAAGCAIGIAIATVVSSFVLGSLGQVMLLMNLPVRCLVVALLLMPLGFLLGTPFPSGMRLFSQRRAGQVPLIWGLNGVSSVVGSLCAAMGAKSWGFNNVMVAGAVVYLGAALLLMGIDKLQNQPVLSVNNGEGEADRPLTADVNSTGTAQEPTGSVPVGS